MKITDSKIFPSGLQFQKAKYPLMLMYPAQYSSGASIENVKMSVLLE